MSEKEESYNLDDLEWRCQECGATAPPTGWDYMVILSHQKGHHVRLVVKETGEALAGSVKQAQARGIDIPTREKKQVKQPGRTVGKVELSPGGKSDGKSDGKSEAGMELTEEGISFIITLPPVAFTLFDAAKANKLVDEDKDFDIWLFECIQKRFELEYELRLMLIPIGEGE